MNIVRGRLRIHEPGNSLLLLEPDSYLLLFEIDLPEFYYCVIISGGALWSTLISAAQSMMMVLATSSCPCLGAVSANQSINMAMSAIPVADGEVGGGHC